MIGLALILLLSACGGGAPPDSAAEPPSSTEVSEPPMVLPTFSVPATPTPLQPGEAETPMVQPAIPERRLLALEYPPRIRAGDSDIVRLTLEVDESGNLTPTAEVEGNVVTGEVIEIPNLYETHHVIVEARFDAAGMQISPPDLTSQTLSPGQTVRFFWSIRPDEPGIYRGTVWLYLRFADKVSGEESQRAVSAQIVEIEAVNLFGIPARVVRVAGGVGSVIGAVVGFPFFEDVVKFLFSRRRVRRTKS
jgi:hypothetical protein